LERPQGELAEAEAALQAGLVDGARGGDHEAGGECAQDRAQFRQIEDPGDRPRQGDQRRRAQAARGEHDPEGGGGEILVAIGPLHHRVRQPAPGDDLQDVDEDGGDRHHAEFRRPDQAREHEEHPEAQDDVAHGGERYPAGRVEGAAGHVRCGAEARDGLGSVCGRRGLGQDRRASAHERVARRSATSSA
jgi:hypothetical protein